MEDVENKLYMTLIYSLNNKCIWKVRIINFTLRIYNYDNRGYITNQHVYYI